MKMSFSTNLSLSKKRKERTNTFSSLSSSKCTQNKEKKSYAQLTATSRLKTGDYDVAHESEDDNSTLSDKLFMVKIIRNLRSLRVTSLNFIALFL